MTSIRKSDKPVVAAPIALIPSSKPPKAQAPLVPLPKIGPHLPPTDTKPVVGGGTIKHLEAKGKSAGLTREALLPLGLMPRVQTKVLALADRVSMYVEKGDWKNLLAFTGKGEKSMPDAQAIAENLGVHSVDNNLAAEGKPITWPLLRSVKHVSFTKAEWSDRNHQVFTLEGEALIEDEAGRRRALITSLLCQIVPGDDGPRVRVVEGKG